MTGERRFMRCQLVRANNGIVEALFTRDAEYAHAHSQEEIVSINWKIPFDRFSFGKTYCIEIWEGGPTDDDRPR